jgi:hypothetical protein
MVRGIERTDIVLDDEDRRDFLNRIGKAAEKTGTVIHVWALMSNHAHLLLRSGSAGLPTFIRKVLTGPVTFNKQHHLTRSPLGKKRITYRFLIKYRDFAWVLRDVV